MRSATVACGGCKASWYVEDYLTACASLEEHRATAHANDDLGPSPLEAATEREPGEDDGP